MGGKKKVLSLKPGSQFWGPFSRQADLERMKIFFHFKSIIILFWG